MVLQGLIDQLNEHGVQVCWAGSLKRPGLWVAAASLLVLSAAATPDGLAASCSEVLAGYSPTSVPSASAVNLNAAPTIVGIVVPSASAIL